MTNEEISKLAKKVANDAHILSTPMDLDQLLEDGLLKKIGNSYYTDNIHALPDLVVKKVKSSTPTQNGIKLTFYKETKSIQKLADRTKHLRE